MLRFAVGDNKMGSVVDEWHPEQPRRIRIHAVGSDAIERIDILSGNKILHTDRPQQSDESLLEWIDDSVLSSESAYRVRLRQVDGHSAWSSPIWVRPLSR